MDEIRLIDPPYVVPNMPPLPWVDMEGIGRKRLDVPYGEAERQKLDVFLPETGEGPFPTIVFFHGGAFLGGNRKDVQLLYAIRGIFRGYAVVSADYRMVEDAVFPAAVEDARAVVEFLRAHAGEYRLDPGKFAVMGDSAGAYLAAMVGAEGNTTSGAGVQAVVGICGVYDLIKQSQFTEDQRSSGDEEAATMPQFADMFMGLNCREHPEVTERAWPGSFVKENYPPMLLLAGTADQIVPSPCSHELVDRVNAVCGAGRAQCIPCEGFRHCDPHYNDPECEEQWYEFLDKHLK